MERIFPVSKEAASWLLVFRPIERVYEGDALMVEASDNYSVNVQV